MALILILKDSGNIRENARTEAKAVIEFPGKSMKSGFGNLFVGVSKPIRGTMNNSGQGNHF